MPEQRQVVANKGASKKAAGKKADAQKVAAKAA
jgi:hypothetical protein